jgi:hypothetical protein
MRMADFADPYDAYAPNRWTTSKNTRESRTAPY